VRDAVANIVERIVEGHAGVARQAEDVLNSTFKKDTNERTRSLHC